MVWVNYTSGGEKPPRVKLVNDGSIIATVDFDDIAAAAVIPSPGFWARLRDERFVPDAELRKRIDGIKQPIKGGFYYEVKVHCPLLDKTYAGLVNAIINHCMTPGNFYAHFYPHLDNTETYFVAHIAGQVKPYEKGDRAYYFAHTADLEVYGLEPFPEIPWTENYILQVWKDGETYTPAEMANMMVWKDGETYTAAELTGDIGYVLKDNKIHNFAI